MSAQLLSIRDIDGGAANHPTGGQATPPRKNHSVLQQVSQTLFVGALALLSYFFISHYILQSVQVQGSSMWPTLQDSDHYFLNRFAYELREPRRGEIVVVRDPTDGAYCVKRVIALPGESLVFKNGRLFVNGKELQESYLPYGVKTFTPEKVQEELVTCGKDRYFILGDNRNNSFDSRYYGPIARQNILGVVMR